MLLKEALRAVHTAEWQVLKGARSHGIRQAIAAITAVHLTRKAYALLVSAQRYAGRFLHILKTVPAAQRQAAINALKEEQALETQTQLEHRFSRTH